MLDAIDRFTWYEVDYDYNTPSLQIAFYISGVRIEVPMSELVIRYRTTYYLDVFPKPSGSSWYALLGENFLRNAYVVYDLKELEILLAQAEYADEEDIEVVTLAISSAVQAAGYSEPSINYSLSNTGTVTVVDFSGLESATSFGALNTDYLDLSSVSRFLVPSDSVTMVPSESDTMNTQDETDDSSVQATDSTTTEAEVTTERTSNAASTRYSFSSIAGLVGLILMAIV